MQIHNGLGTSAGIQLLHHQIRLDAQQQRLTGIGTTGGSTSLQGLSFKQGLFTELVVARLKTSLCSGLKSRQRGGLDCRCRKAENNQDCDGAR